MKKLRSQRRGVVALSALLAAGVLTACTPRPPWQSELVSVNAAGSGSGDHDSLEPVLSPDGTRVAFASRASDLGPPDTNGQWDVYVRDLASGTTTLVSANAAGTDGGNGESRSPMFADDGTKVVFASRAADLGPPDANGAPDVYVRDLASGTTSLVSVNAAGTGSGNGTSDLARVSQDGTKVAFRSLATDLRAAAPTLAGQVYVHDLASGATTLASVNASGTDGGNGTSLYPALSADGTKVAFISFANDLGPADTTAGGLLGGDVYVRDLVAGTTTLASVNAAGTDAGNGQSLDPVLSPDGTKVAFRTRASDLGPRDTNESDDIYVRDLVAGTTGLASVNERGISGGNNGSSGPMAFSPDGTKLAFFSYADNLGPIDTVNGRDLFVRDLVAGTTTLVTANPEGTDSALVWLDDGVSFSPDGTKIAFSGDAVNLVDVATNLGHDDVYVRDLVHETTTLVSSDPTGTTTGNGNSSVPSPRILESAWGQARAVFSPDGGRIVFVSQATNLSPPDQDDPDATGNLGWDVYMATSPGADRSGLAPTAGQEQGGS